MKGTWSNTGTRRRHAARRTPLVAAFAVTIAAAQCDPWKVPPV